MKKILLLGLLLGGLSIAHAQNPPATSPPAQIDRNNLQIRPNSRDYMIVRKGNDHQRLLQNRKNALMMRRLAIMNRRQAMDRRRDMLQKKMMRQQQVRQRLIHQRGTHR
jgi:hypothetical protein